MAKSFLRPKSKIKIIKWTCYRRALVVGDDPPREVNGQSLAAEVVDRPGLPRAVQHRPQRFHAHAHLL